MCNLHVRPELTATAKVRQGDDRVRERTGDLLTDDRRAQHGRYNEHVIARAWRTCRSNKTLKAGGDHGSAIIDHLYLSPIVFSSGHLRP